MKLYLILFCLIYLSGCTEVPHTYEKIQFNPPIIPDYTNITIPRNIAPLNFYLDDFCEKVEVKFSLNGQEQFVCQEKRAILIPERKWKKLLEQAAAQKIPVQLDVAKKMKNKWYTYNTVYLSVAEEIDPYIAYRLIPPGYESWEAMGIYQRNLTNFEETPVMQNSLSDQNCMNCHSFSDYQPDRFTLHMRGKLGGTLLINGRQLKKLDTKTAQTISTFTYPSWHPSGKLIAFSTNITAQFFHALKEKQIEVFDMNSDIVLYDVAQNQVIKDTLLAAGRYFETYPTWAPDGKTLYFCRMDSLQMPYPYKEARYMICSIPFDPDQKQFGNQIDTVYQWKGSCAFPRISPDGRFLLFTRMDYGCFPIWHREADLCMWDLQNQREVEGEANGPETDSYHSWSSNGKWVVFSSRRADGLFTRLYLSYVDAGGKMQKPFLLPQKDFEVNHPSLNSYNVPEFIKGKVRVSPYKLEHCARQEAVRVQ